MISAVVFDLDGTVIDSEGLWEETFREIVTKSQITNNKLQNNSWIHQPGLGLLNNWKNIVDDEKLAEKLTRETWILYSQKSREMPMAIKPGMEEAIKKAKERGWMTALCTGSNWHVVEKELEDLQLYLAFDVTTTGDEVVLQKPDPEIYLLTAQKLGVEPEECMVIEDAIPGIQAAIDAGMKTVGLVSSYAPREKLREMGADIVVADTNQISVLLEKIG